MKIKHDFPCLPLADIPAGQLFRGYRRGANSETIEVLAMKAYHLSHSGEQKPTFVELTPASGREWRSDQIIPAQEVMNVDEKYQITWEPAIPAKPFPSNRNYGEIFICPSGKFLSVDAVDGFRYVDLKSGRIVEAVEAKKGYWTDKFVIEEIPESIQPKPLRAE